MPSTNRSVCSRRAALTALSSAAGCLICSAGPNATYAQKLEAERKAADEHFKSIHGPLTLIARFSPKEGTSTLGTDSSSSLVLSGSAAPPRIGEVNVTGGKAVLRFASGVQATIDGKQVTSVETDSKAAKALSAKVGALTLHLYFIRGEQLQISVSDPNSTLRKEAQPLSWFPIDPKRRIIADWIAYAQPKHVMFLDNDGSSRERNLPGYAAFQVDGRKLRLTAILRPENPKPFFVFGDLTNGHETYGAGRFLQADPPNDGKITLDFNTAYNPLCAYNHEYLCPVAPKENRLPVPIRAGERTYPGHHS